eukprot:Em0008g584a
MSRAYTEVVFWKKNVFTVPLGASGKSFASELAQLFQAYSDGSGLESIALKAITVASRLLLQKPFRTSKAKDHTSCLERRLTSWKEGKIDILLLEGRTIQQRLPASDSYTHANEDITRSFTKLMFEGNFIFDGIDASAIKSAVLQTEGSAGPSGIDAKGWRRLCTSFHSASVELCKSLAALARREGTTQGDPLAMPMYALGILPLIQRSTGDILQVWYAEDVSATGTIHNLREWWEKITTIGPSYGYNANATKHSTNVNITSEGRPHLGVPLGTETYVAQSIQKKVAKGCLQLQTLCSIAITQPHAIFAAFTHSVVHQWTYLARTVPNISTFFTPIEDIIRSNLIPSLTGRAPPGDLERLLLSLPPRLGGLGFTIPTNLSAIEFDASMTVTKPLYSSCKRKHTIHSV